MIYLSFLISKRFNSQFRNNSIIPIVSIISKIGIFLGIFVLIVSLSALNGFQLELNNRIISILPHGEIFPIDHSFKNWKEIKRLLESSSDIVSVTPYISTTALINHKNGIKGIQLRGVNFNENYKLHKFKKFIQFKTFKMIKKNHNQIILGKNIAKSLSIRKGDWINIIIPSNYNHKELYPKYISLKILDFFQINGSIDNTLALVPILDLKKYLNMKANVSGLEISVKNPFDTIKVFKNIKLGLPENFFIKNWIFEYGNIYHDIKLVKTIVYVTMTLVIVISCFNIASVTFLEISKKINSIAILKTLGMNNIFILIVFLIHGIKSIMTIGCFSLLLSVISLWNFKYFLSYIEKYLGQKLLSNAIYFVDSIPISIAYSDIFLIFLILFLIGCITSYYSAYHASKVNPVEILKNIK
ncbi:MAG: FtsX-like permease family protein [Buchnera aphidicola (Schlechtendalia peitan)]